MILWAHQPPRKSVELTFNANVDGDFEAQQRLAQFRVD